MKRLGKILLALVIIYLLIGLSIGLILYFQGGIVNGFWFVMMMSWSWPELTVFMLFMRGH